MKGTNDTEPTKAGPLTVEIYWLHSTTKE